MIHLTPCCPIAGVNRHGEVDAQCRKGTNEPDLTLHERGDSEAQTLIGPWLLTTAGQTTTATTTAATSMYE